MATIAARKTADFISNGFAYAIGLAFEAHNVNFDLFEFDGVEVSISELMVPELRNNKAGIGHYNVYPNLVGLPGDFGQALIDAFNECDFNLDNAKGRQLAKKAGIAVPENAPAKKAPAKKADNGLARFAKGAVSADVQAVVDHVNRAVPKPAKGHSKAKTEKAAPSNSGLNDGSSEIEILVQRAVAAAMAQHGLNEPVAVESPNMTDHIPTIRLGGQVRIIGENGEELGYAEFKGITDGGKWQVKRFVVTPE